jgi:hypothetical protein
MAESLKIVVLSMAAAIGYGILHDQVTARVCIEYFTIGHVRVIASRSPTLLAFTWGVLATWWVGFGLGIPVALFARAGGRRALSWSDLRRPYLTLMIATEVASLLFGMLAYFIAEAGGVYLLEPLASRVPANRHTRFLADLWAHRAAYATGLTGSVVLCGWCVWRRGQLKECGGCNGR